MQLDSLPMELIDMLYREVDQPALYSLLQVNLTSREASGSILSAVAQADPDPGCTLKHRCSVELFQYATTLDDPRQYLDWLLEQGVFLATSKNAETVICDAAARGNLHLLDWMYVKYRHAFPAHTAVAHAIRNKRREALQWLVRTGCTPTDESIKAVVESRDMTMLSYLFHNHSLLTATPVFSYICVAGWLEALTWYTSKRQKDLPVNAYTMTGAWEQTFMHDHDHMVPALLELDKDKTAPGIAALAAHHGAVGCLEHLWRAAYTKEAFTSNLVRCAAYSKKDAVRAWLQTHK